MNLFDLTSEFDLATLQVWGLGEHGKCRCGAPHDQDSASGKHPIDRNSLINATVNPRQAEEWLLQGHNVGINCAKSNIVVIDIDPRNDGYESWERLTGPLPGLLPKTLTVLTGAFLEGGNSTRGRHLYYAVESGASFAGSFGPDYPGIDIKHNGYVIAPGSKHSSGVTYEIEAPDEGGKLEISPLPKALRDIMGSTAAKTQTSHGVVDVSIFASPITDYGRKALEDESHEIRRSQEGSRNRQLFDSGLRIGSLISGGHIPGDEAFEVLISAAEESGLSREEAVRTLVRTSGQGALQLGAANPRGPEVTPSSLVSWASSASVGLGQLTSSQDQNLYPGFLNVVNWHEAFSAEVGDDWLLPGLIARGRSHLLYSMPGLGKSLLALDISVRLAAGMEVLGKEAGDPIKVLYLDHENSIVGDVVPRLREMGFGEDDLEMLVYCSFPDMDTLDTEEGGNQLRQTLDSVNPDFVILDTVSRAIAGEENNNTTWLKLYKFAGQLLKSRGITFVRLDHVGKDSSQGPRGGSAKTGDVDMVWKLTGTPGGSRFGLVCEKSRLVVPATNLSLIRETEPVLRHTTQTSNSEINWSELYLAYSKTQEVQALIAEDAEKTGGIEGQKPVWLRLKGKVKSIGATHDQFVIAHRLVKEELDSLGAVNTSDLASG